MTPQDTTKRQATSALDGTLCSMHTAKMATHTGTDARITWHGRMRLRVVRSSRRGRRGEAVAAGRRAGWVVAGFRVQGRWPQAGRACLIHRELHHGERGVVARDLEAVHQGDRHQALPVVLEHVHVLVRVLWAEEHERRQCTAPEDHMAGGHEQGEAQAVQAECPSIHQVQ